jgi:hypothetical protein
VRVGHCRASNERPGCESIQAFFYLILQPFERRVQRHLGFAYPFASQINRYSNASRRDLTSWKLPKVKASKDPERFCTGNSCLHVQALILQVFGSLRAVQNRISTELVCRPTRGGSRVR